MSTWKLYWVEVAFDPTENCFVVAKNARSARSVEYGQWGESYDKISAEFVLDIPEHIESRIIEHYKNILQQRLNNPDDEDDTDSLQKQILTLNSLEDLWPDYADHRPVAGNHWLLSELGTERYYRERRFITEINDFEYTTGSFEDYLGGMIDLKDPNERNITSVDDFKSKIEKLKNEKIIIENLIYRGQSNAYSTRCTGISRHY